MKLGGHRPASSPVSGATAPDHVPVPEAAAPESAPLDARLLEVARPVLALARRHGRSAALLSIELGGLSTALARLDFERRLQVLEYGARRIRTVVRDSDVVARASRDGFVVVLSDLWEEGAARHVAERLLAELKRGFPDPGEEGLLRLPVRIGAALLPGDGEDAEVLAGHARQAMARIADGESGLRFYGSATGGMVASDAGAGAGPPPLLFRPVLDLAAGHVVAADALIGVGADASLSQPSVDPWRLEELIAQAAAWRRAGWTGWVSARIPDRCFHDARLIPTLAAAIHGHGLPPGALAIEVTGPAAELEPEMIGRQLGEAQALGARITLSDFGARRVWLDALLRMRPHLVRLDTSLLAGPRADGRRRRAVEALILLCHHLDTPVLVEGVGRESDRDWLSEVGCDLIQGDVVGAAVTAPVFAGHALGSAA